MTPLNSTNCPHCGTELSVPLRGTTPRFYKCQGRVGSPHRTGYCREREAHRKTCENAQRVIEKSNTELEKLKSENICLQEIIQEFYEWSRRDYPTEAEVREIMDRYYNLLNK
jgi:hypothetical protein